MSGPFQQITIVGVGILGSSLALSLKAQRQPPRLVGFDPSTDSRRAAMALKAGSGGRAFDSVSGSLAEAVRGSDLVVISTPVRAMELLLRELGLLVTPGTVVTDTGGTKRQVLDWAEALLPESVPFVGGSPMAFKIGTGAHDAEAGLFADSLYCLCPLPRTPQEAVGRIVKLVESLRAVPYFLDAAEHDGLQAAVDHLPRLLAVALINCAVESRIWREAATMAGTGFATATHLATADPTVLADLALTNRQSTTWQLDQIINQLTALRTAIVSGDEALGQLLEQARERHRSWISGQASAGPEAAPPVDTSAVRTSSMLLPSQLTNLLRRKRPSDDN